MKNPYEVLGVREDADENEIKKVYRTLVKKYHPDQYSDNPLKKLAEEKLREINEAYDNIIKTRSSGSGAYGSYGDRSGSNAGSSGRSGDFNDVRQKINLGQLSEAEALLDRMTLKTAEWYFLKGLLFFKRGWYDTAFNHVQTACNMDPTNYEYRQTLNSMNRTSGSFRQSAGSRGSKDDSCDNICTICTVLYCVDSCCECGGGDCIRCC